MTAVKLFSVTRQTRHRHVYPQVLLRVFDQEMLFTPIPVAKAGKVILESGAVSDSQILLTHADRQQFKRDITLDIRLQKRRQPLSSLLATNYQK